MPTTDIHDRHTKVESQHSKEILKEPTTMPEDAQIASAQEGSAVAPEIRHSLCSPQDADSRGASEEALGGGILRFLGLSRWFLGLSLCLSIEQSMSAKETLATDIQLLCISIMSSS